MNFLNLIKVSFDDYFQHLMHVDHLTKINNTNSSNSTLFDENYHNETIESVSSK